MKSTKYLMKPLCAIIAGATLAVDAIAAPNYGEALQKSIYFYEAQQSGPIPDWNRNEWRGDSGMTDGADNNVDLLGGWYDAGDHVKFGFPMASSATMLAWGVVENREAYEQTGQLQHMMNNLRFVADYFVKAHTAPNEFWGQVGNGGLDHGWWGSAEVMPMERPSYKIDANCPGSDLAGETAAALAAISMVFESTDAAYATNLLEHAKQLYSFADNYRGKYTDCITDAASYYNSWSGYNDELVWGAAWLYRATGEQSYLDKAVSYYDNLSTEPQQPIKSYRWTHAWDDKSYGSYVLMAKLTGDDQYRADAERWLDYWSTGYEGNRVTYTPGGLAHLDQWGAARYAANTAFIALIYSDYLQSADPGNSRAQDYYNFAVGQMEYLLGDNRMNMSYQIGYGSVYPTSPHHRTAHGSWNDSLQDPVENRHTLVGALVGGPDTSDNFVNDRGDYVLNEVATDYNAGFTGALARLWLDFGGNPIPDSQFPAPETRDVELFVDAKLNSSSARHTEISSYVHNRTAWPARLTDNLSLRYWIDISELVDAGYGPEDLVLSSGYNQGSGFTGPHPWGDPADNIYYVEVSFAGVDIYPGGQSASKKETQYRIGAPEGAPWDPENDPSWDGYNSTRKEAPLIALYDDGELVWGQEPGGGCGGDTGVNCAPSADSQNLSTPYETSLSVTLSGSDSDGSIAAYTVVNGPANGTLEGSGASRLYTPAAGFFGTDSFTFTVTDNDGATSQPATISIEVEAPEIPAVNITSPVDGARFAPGADVRVQYNLQNAEGVNLYLDGTLVATGSGSGTLTVQAPDEIGFYMLKLVATQDGEELSASDSVTFEVAEAPAGSLGCTVGQMDDWGAGFVLNNITVTNEGSEPVDGWTVLLDFGQEVTIGNHWNASLSSTSGSQLSASNVSYNGSLQPGQSATFGMQGTPGNLGAVTCTAQ
ncbi:glycoside hydrolase family 9 protein [Microbulbifer thermotolerans]|uniref:glycoside hydrolase family 9 protein n=1 Tax=Microbulbifer thermotolerans TaxID=252514 RepID=UPI00224A594F|nr:glycoside hydrolase family 9 protein [Microbulbifer thermotolerans]MCX2835461.1 glycoside hydrolase family 9 protein [Microbulbifer thermotolerans]